MGTLEYEKFDLSSNKFSSKIKLIIKTDNVKNAATVRFVINFYMQHVLPKEKKFFAGI